MPENEIPDSSEYYADDVLPYLSLCPKGQGFIWITPCARLNLLAPNSPSEIKYPALIDVMTRTTMFGVADRIGYTRSQFCLLMSLLFEQRDLALGALIFPMPNGILPQHPGELDSITPKQFLTTVHEIRVRLRKEFYAGLGLSFSEKQDRLIWKRFLMAYWALYHKHVLTDHLDPRVVPDPALIPAIRQATADFKAMADQRLHPTALLSLHDRTGLPVDIATKLLRLEGFGPRHDGEGYLQRRFDFLCRQPRTNPAQPEPAGEDIPTESGFAEQG